MTAQTTDAAVAARTQSAAAHDAAPAGQPDPTPHLWVAAAEVTLSPKQVAGVARRLTMTVDGAVHIDVVDVYCHRCRRSFSQARHTDCDVEAIPKGGPGRKKGASERDVEAEPALQSAS